MSRPTRFAGTLDLARLPWFESDGRRLRVAAPGIGPIIDVHTHLALSYLLPARVDLQREHARTEHYLPVDRELDLEVYANRNFTPADLRRLERDLSLGSLGAGGMRRTHTLANLGREMAELGVVVSVLLAIDFPLLSDNAGIWLRAARGRGAFVVFGSVHPYRPFMERELDRQVALGARGIKLHPAVQNVLPADRRAMALYRMCGRRGLPVFFHCGPVGIENRVGRWLSQVRHYRRAIEGNPDTRFVLGHTGALQCDEAIELARAHDNVYVETSSQSLTCVRRILDRVDPARILFGSDWPFYHQAIPLAKLLIATEGREPLRRRVLYDNAAGLLMRP
ncbi:MAG TPA: amidohydrolase family protein [Kofleriaceae bacterium]|nr:amidohydrolase family protein [Kofleriaceae bacterium]